MSQHFVKDPSATLDYTINWSNWLGTDTITASLWTVPTGITKISDTFDTQSATIWLSGGTVDTEYDIVNRITTTAGRIDERTITVKVVQR